MAFESCPNSDLLVEAARRAMLRRTLRVSRRGSWDQSAMSAVSMGRRVVPYFLGINLPSLTLLSKVLFGSVLVQCFESSFLCCFLCLRRPISRAVPTQWELTVVYKQLLIGSGACQLEITKARGGQLASLKLEISPKESLSWSTLN